MVIESDAWPFRQVIEKAEPGLGWGKISQPVTSREGMRGLMRAWNYVLGVPGNQLGRAGDQRRPLKHHGWVVS